MTLSNNMGPDEIDEKKKMYSDKYPLIKANYLKYYVMNKGGIDETNNLSRTEAQWEKLSQEVNNLEAIVKYQIKLNKNLVDSKSKNINNIKGKWIKENRKLKHQYKSNIAGKPMRKQLYDEHTNHIIETIFYSISIVGMGIFMYKQIKEKLL